MLPAPGEGWSPRCGGGQFAQLQGDRAAYANVPAGLSFEEQMSTELEASPQSGCVHGTPREIGDLGDQLHCRLQALTGSGMGPAVSHAHLSYNFRDSTLSRTDPIHGLPWL